MALSTSPRKVIPLSTGDSPKPSRHPPPGFTKRIFYCGVVIEGSENGRRLPDDIQDLVLSLGEPLDSCSETSILSSSSNSAINNTDGPLQRKRALTNTSALTSVINELVSTERSYVQRIRTLKNDYADPLRKFSRSKETAIIPSYEAKTLFGNIDNLVPVNEAFLADLDAMMASNDEGPVGGIGDICLKHFKELKGFEHYKQYYTKREEAQSIFEREIAKRSSGFAAFIDRIKYSSADSRNRVGLRELLMEPVQRIPRYTLLFRTMIKHMAEDDPQRAKLIEADEIASKIAQAEADEQTKRAAIMYCLSASVDGFPPGLFSHSRRFIDCIDVQDIITDAPNASSTNLNLAGSALHCTLFLFDDKLMIVKRPGNGEKSGAALSGLEGLDKVTRGGGLPTGKKKSGMVCKGIMDITEVVATDVGGADMHFYLESPPQDQSERWSGRPFRSFAVVRPPMPVNMDPTQTEEDKRRFLENLWSTQARYRARAGQSVVLRADEREVESHSGRTTVARTYYNVYTRTAFLQEEKKTKVVVHIDALGSADPLPFGMAAPPYVVIRLQPMAGDLARYRVTSSDPNVEVEEDIIQCSRVAARIPQTINQYGLFKFTTGHISAPSTPTASIRSRAAIFGLDAISRNLFNSRPGSAMGDFFGGSISGHRRTKSSTSRSSVFTQSTSTGDGSVKFSHRSNSTTTAATTVSSGDDDSSFFASSTTIKSRKLFKRAKSPGGTTLYESDSRNTSPTRSVTRGSSSERLSRDSSAERLNGDVYSDYEPEDSMVLDTMADKDSSEWDLAMRLALARQNSRNQHGVKPLPALADRAVEETIYEEDPPPAIRPASRSSGFSKDSHTTQSSAPTIRPTTPGLLSQPDSPPRRSRSPQPNGRPLGPRCPSPLPPSPRFELLAPEADDELMDEDYQHDNRHFDPTPASRTNSKSSIPRSKRQPLFPMGNTDATPKASGTQVREQREASPPPPSTPSVAPLSVKKKTTSISSASMLPSPSPAWRTSSRNSPLSRPRPVSARKVSPQVRQHNHTTPTRNGSLKREDHDDIMRLAETTKEDVDSCNRAVKRIRLEVEELKSVPPSGDDISRPSSPDKAFRGLRQTPAMTKAAQERMEEMRKAIGRRQGEYATPTRPFPSPSLARAMSPAPGDGGFSKTAASLGNLVDDLATKMERTSTDYHDLYSKLRHLNDQSKELQQTKFELSNSRRQCELVKSLLDETIAEKEIMYEAFNEELDGMYNDVNLPDDEAWTAMVNDLRQTKETRNTLSKENSKLKRKLAEMQSQHEEWGALLRANGLLR
ncbi:hypothetical protein EYR40_005316 [Pleurotus pulmonarius]|nr:hypothetical protein EYR40_005316 [Pleurotus pulmonarius]